MRYKPKPRSMLTSLWAFLLFNMIFRDLHQFGKADFIREILTGTVNGVTITDELMLFGGFLAEVPIAMLLVSKLAADRINKWANIIAALVTMFVLLSALPYADLDDIFFLIVEVLTLLTIIRVAWKINDIALMKES